MRIPHKIRPWDPKSKEYFSIEKKNLSSFLKKKKIKHEIHHVGSTAVPGLGGKGVIDILVEVSKKDRQRTAIFLDHDTEFTYGESGGDAERAFFTKKRKIKGRIVKYHLHLTWKNSKTAKDHLAFIKYMKKHPKQAKEYYELKKKLNSSNLSRHGYRNLKGRFIKKIMKG